MQLPGWSEKYLATMGWTYKMLSYSYLKIDPEEKTHENMILYKLLLPT